jgi:hypothetical protein
MRKTKSIYNVFDARRLFGVDKGTARQHSNFEARWNLTMRKKRSKKNQQQDLS